MTWATITFEKVIMLLIFIFLEYLSIKRADRLKTVRTIEEIPINSSLFNDICVLGIFKLFLFAMAIGVQFGGD